MKKILLAVVIVLMMASPVMADVPIVVNGVGMQLEEINIDNQLYVPLYTLNKVFGIDMQWDGTGFIANTVNRPSITGDDNFKAIVTQALDLLQVNDPPDYEMVCKHTKGISFTETIPTKYGVNAYAGSDGSNILIARELVKSTRYTPVCAAGTLVHESTHNCNTKNGITRGSKQDENMAYLHQITALRTLGASQKDIEDTEDALEWVLKK